MAAEKQGKVLRDALMLAGWGQKINSKNSMVKRIEIET
jgi:hypothetical protein